MLMHDVRQVGRLFEMRADFVDAQPYGSGHINDTYCAWYDQAGLRLRYIHQRINHSIFKDPAALMENISRVTDHSLQRLLEEQHPEARRRTLTVIPAVGGLPYAVDRDGNFWRTYPFIERARGYDEIRTGLQAEEAARAFGAFQKLTADLPGKRLTETIPNFHHTPARLAALRDAIAADVAGRAVECAAEIEFALSRAEDCHRVTNQIAEGLIPERVTHNDTKLNNVLLDDVTSEGVCV
ncbi:MAG: aminoglycoside phosphotransferase family protein, partial [Akkermansiaceae bacterium]|nr:aminoglycoside phosphotransferase family protein [Akkermansiaceae bacterium]